MAYWYGIERRMSFARSFMHERVRHCLNIATLALLGYHHALHINGGK